MYIVLKGEDKIDGVTFENPYIYDKNTLYFSENSLGVSKAAFDIKLGKVIIHVNNKKILIKVDDKNKEMLRNFHKEEFLKANNYFKKLKNKECELFISECDDICTKELIENNFNPYYQNLFMFSLNSNLKTKFDNPKNILDEILKKVNLNEYNIESSEFGDYHIVPLTDIFS